MDATAEAAIGTGGNAKCERLIGLRRLVDFDPQPLPLQWFARLVWGFSCQVVILVCSRFLVRRGKAVLRPVACDQVRGARGRGQGTETLAKA